ncbi:MULTISPECIES: hypothetical protein [Novosphingobium]|jgi:hypothetical protein|uniref:Uncharacterized protein n=1 Tax=Novosphingobium subterraneum TaxID=48936 RepID=A0A0B8ZY25_9SPHN|nr:MULTISPECIES: hypothetical protein [Novosphingobium]KHS43217.1 hypothetical protein NJ75_03846 [Novosphingobium subterraneum]QOV93124.1 hypothetical protein IM701_10760 [Novosphingobium sp. ES2-1]
MLRFAPRYGIISPCLSRRIQARHLRAVNDNGAGSICQDEALDAALRLFAAHGFSAAARARDAAVIAERSGEPSRVEFWVEVCATLDRRMARDFLKRKRS